MKILKPVLKCLMIVMLLCNGLSNPVFAQEEVRLGIREGMPAIPLAIPGITFSDKSVKDEQVKKEIYETLWADIKYSRVFALVPRSHYDYIQKFDPGNIIFKDWASIQANILLVGELEVSPEDRLIFSVKVFEVNSRKFLFGRNFGGKKEFVRLIAHRAADEMMKYFGEKAIFTSKITFVSSRDENNEIYIMDYDGKRQKRITYNQYIDILPSWSRDNEKILYTSYKKGTPDLFMYYIYTGKTDMVSHGGVNYSADWSPEGEKIIYTSSKKDKNAEIYLRYMDTGKEKRLTFNRAIDTSPSWSPNGKEIAFVSQRTGIPRIYIMDSEGTNVRCITYDGSHFDSPAWSPDGTRIAYVSMVEGRLDIYIYNLKDNTIIKMTENAGRNEDPTWSPDSRHIVFSSNRNGRYQLYSIDYDGTNLKRLTAKGENKMSNWQKK